MGSELNVDSEYGKGSNFYFVIDVPLDNVSQSELERLYMLPDNSRMEGLVDRRSHLDGELVEKTDKSMIYTEDDS